jgi:hypothetical protein
LQALDCGGLDPHAIAVNQDSPEAQEQNAVSPVALALQISYRVYQILEAWVEAMSVSLSVL